MLRSDPEEGLESLGGSLQSSPFKVRHIRKASESSDEEKIEIRPDIFQENPYSENKEGAQFCMRKDSSFLLSDSNCDGQGETHRDMLRMLN